MRISLQLLLFGVAWLAVILGLSSLAISDAATNIAPKNIAKDVLCGLNVAFSLTSALLAIRHTGEKKYFWIGVVVVASTLTVLQIADLLPKNAAKQLGYRIMDWIASSKNPKGSAEVWYFSHLDQITILLLYSWTPLVSLAGGCIASRGKNAV